MNRSQFLLLVCYWVVFLAYFGEAVPTGEKVEAREKRSMPNWSMSSEDFFGWVEELRSLAGYEHIDELAKVFWAHFPSASRLGYEVPDAEE
ncbi:otospiralin-like [Ambystoma mexicanum]|uniref:otospiralin-like n=1 Tax=Ambystoma mexicanum TaxID=8296 RepID=UPI0037E8080D